MISLPNPHANNLSTISLTAFLFFPYPIKSFAAFVQCLAHINARNRPLPTSVFRIVIGCIDAPNRQLIKPQFFGGLVEQRFDRAGDLILSGTPLCPPDRRIGIYGNPPKAHGLGRINQRNRIASSSPIAASAISTIFLNHVQIQCADPPIAAKTNFNSSLKTVACRPDEILFRATNAHHHGPPDFFRHKRRNRHHGIRRAFGTKTASAVFCNIDQFFRLHLQETGQIARGTTLALRCAIHETLAVLPIGHARPRFHRMMRIICCDKALIHDQFGISKPLINLAIRPLSCGFARRTHIFPHEIPSSPFDCLASRTSVANIAIFAGICTAGIKTFQGIECKGQGFIINRDFVNRILCRLLINRGNCQNRVPHIMGIIRQNGIGRCVLLGHIVSR